MHGDLDVRYQVLEFPTIQRQEKEKGGRGRRKEKEGGYLNLKFWCVGGADVVVPWLVRGIPAVQSGCGSGVGRVCVGFGPGAFRTKI